MAKVAYVSLELEEPSEKTPEWPLKQVRPAVRKLSWWRSLVRWILRKVEGDA